MDFLLQAEGLTRKYKNKVALNNFSINIPQGSIYGLLGPNGAGKTTFIRIVNQITAPDSGTILLNGEPLTKKSIGQVGYMPEERGLYKNMKVGEQALYFAKLKGLSSAEARKRTEYWFEKLDMMSWWNKKLSELSKGMGQKVQFVITVIHNPSLLIFDEPFSGFDPVNAQIIANEILELRDKGTTIIFSTHRMESVEEMCDHVALINQSNKVLDGTIEEVRNQFKTGKFSIQLDEVASDALQNLANEFEISDMRNFNQRTEFNLLYNKETPTNEILQKLMQIGQVHQFKEIIPSMNDVFLEAVKQSSISNL
ncbi:ATP-binding cassette domain-containing protein [Empedobacter stercoris]|uniref:ATP-binding cassette domain-containing protein n=2 Tax=Empedobacter TaxID=59734 RepID=A0ABY8VAG5_9FLAO|nr:MULTISPECIES: ATP-binding cassette domain-containing protein [Empedobacter]MCA4777067.1 ATP-binding cassette domain-containing protein [Empedobacter stercoris]MCA4810240.1 ATP-binding cassette domain-containing protein [Empedobacter stercoris]MDM1522754.1 ABC transporter ATP-binding protein [Empedobacter sp. 225-1]MDM1542340.1 ABC transporter ATP-binding protein [Empedobacter sp. 189-2]NOJ76340.1 ABC transporter ATP-binding protein [Empedobacter stercoris]